MEAAGQYTQSGARSLDGATCVACDSKLRLELEEHCGQVLSTARQVAYKDHPGSLVQCDILQ